MIAMLMAAALATSGRAAADVPQGPRVCVGRMSVINGPFGAHLECTDPSGRLPAMTKEQPLTVADAKARFALFTGLVADTATLVVSDGPVPAQGELVHIAVRPSLAGKLTAPFDARGILGGSSSRQLPVGADVYGVAQDTVYNRLLWCGAISDKPNAEAPDRAVCFTDGVRGGLMVSNSVGGDNPFSPGRLNPDMLSRFTEKPAAEIVDAPYPRSFPLILRYLKADKDSILVRIEYGPYDLSQANRRFKRGADGTAVIDLAGGQFRVTPEGDSARVAVVQPMPKDPLLHFQPIDFNGPAPAAAGSLAAEAKSSP